MDRKECKSCEHYEPRWRECYLNPPQVMYDPTKRYVVDIIGVRPPVDPCDRACSHHKEKEANIETPPVDWDKMKKAIEERTEELFAALKRGDLPAMRLQMLKEKGGDDGKN